MLVKVPQSHPCRRRNTLRLNLKLNHKRSKKPVNRSHDLNLSLTPPGSTQGRRMRQTKGRLSRPRRNRRRRRRQVGRPWSPEGGTKETKEKRRLKSGGRESWRSSIHPSRRPSRGHLVLIRCVASVRPSVGRGVVALIGIQVANGLDSPTELCPMKEGEPTIPRSIFSARRSSSFMR